MSTENLANKVDVPFFEDRIDDKELLNTKEHMEVMQVNVGKLCNLACKHCHVEAGPNRTEIMTKETMEACLQVFKDGGFETLDITGGAPEMNPNLEWFLRQAAPLGKVMVRTNLVILDDPKYAHFIDVYKELGVELVCSLPYYNKKQMERQRGTDTFDHCIKILQKLNKLGYGRDPELVLNMVYNPMGAFLPPPQAEIEPEYKKHLKADFDIDFNSLFAITNNPVGRFGDFLNSKNNLDGYIKKLAGAFNPGTVANMMCRNQISIGWDGKVYDCDFNQTIELPITTGETIFDLVGQPQKIRRLALGNHCYACCAGAGSSCGGNTAS